MRKSILLILLLSMHSAWTQIDDQNADDIDEIIEDLINIEAYDINDIIDHYQNYHFIIASTEFNSQSYFLGRDLGIDQYDWSSSLMYENHLGIYLGISGTLYSKFDPKWDVTVLTAGYGIDFGSHDNFKIELGYSNYIFSDSKSNDFNNSLDFSFHAITTNNSLGSTITTSYLFGGKTGFQSSLSIYANLELAELNTASGSKLMFEPNISLSLGSENIDTSRIDNLGIDFPFINNVVDSFETFSLRNIMLNLPIVVSFGNLEIESAVNFNFPKAFDFERNVNNSTYFSFGMNYIFDLN